MGFFSSLLSIGRRVVGAFIPGVAPRTAAVATIPAAAARVAQAGVTVGRRLARPVGRAAAALGGAAAVGAAFQGGANFFDAEGNPISDCPPGQASVVRRTLVQSVDRATGEVICTQVLRGAPFIMRHDIQIAKRVIRTVARLGKVKGISRVVKQSVASRTKDAIEQKVLAQVTKEIC